MDTASALGKGREGTARWSLRLFGDFELSDVPHGEKVTVPGKRERVLLAYLAVSENCRQPRRKLTTLLWGDAGDETALDNLRTCVFNLRKALGDTEHRVISSDGRDIVLDAAAFAVDVLAFRRLAAQSGKAELEAAANLYRGEFLEGLGIDSEEFESWRREEVARCRDRALDVLTRLMTQLAECGEARRAIEVGLRIVRLEPLHEPAVRRVMQLYGESGRRGAAIELYRTFAGTLRTELNAQPEAETRALFAEIAHGGGADGRLPHATAMSSSSETGESSNAPAADDEFAPRDPSIAPPTDPRGNMVRPSFRLRAVLAGVVAIFLVATALIYLQLARFGADQASVAESPASAPLPSAISIAVLPFANLSGDPSQDFFSDGMTEEITSVLARVPGLQVVGRTSAFEFKGQNRDLRAIGAALGASHLIEGSVRKAGTRVRISTQLIRADSGLHVWTENYDRELTDIFAVQEEIAQAIARALQVPLGLKQGESLVSNRTSDTDSYEQYLRARALYRVRSPKSLSQAISVLDSLIARNSTFAPAWGLLSRTYDAAWLHPEPEEPTLILAEHAKEETAAQRAIQLDSRETEGYLSLGLLNVRRGKLILAEELYARALAIDPYHPEALMLRANLLLGVGHLDKALSEAQRSLSLDPFMPINIANGAIHYWLNGRDDTAIAMLEGLPAGNGARWFYQARIYAAAGHYREAAEALGQTPSGTFLPSTLEDATHLLRTAPVATPPDTLPRLGWLGFIYLTAGAPDQVLDYHEAAAQGGYSVAVHYAAIWHPSYAAVRKTERFKTLVRNLGIVEYWRAKGWAEFCHPTTGDDFECN